MRFTALVTAGTLALLPARSDAQVSGAVVIGGGPVRGVVTVGAPVVVERHVYPRVVVVERWHKHKHVHKHKHYVQRVVYYDRRAHVYYDHYRPGLIEVPVYYGGGRYYHRDYDGYRRVRGSYDDRYDRSRDRDWDRDHDRRNGDWDDDDYDRDRDRDWDRNRDRDR